MNFTFIIPSDWALPLHQFFEAAGILIAAYYYRVLKRKQDSINGFFSNNFPVLVGCLIGAGIGNKTMFWFENLHLWAEFGTNIQIFLMGQSMVGGLIGGWIGIEIAKYFAKITVSTGDLFVGPILLGLAVGRIGCFLGGLNDQTYGLATELPWGINFGDNIYRHPTQIYEIVFVLSLWFVLEKIRAKLASVPGLLFKCLFVSYLLWRLIIDQIKPVPYAYAGGLSAIQWACIITLVFYMPLLIKSFWVWKNNYKKEILI